MRQVTNFLVSQLGDDATTVAGSYQDNIPLGATFQRLQYITLWLGNLKGRYMYIKNIKETDVFFFNSKRTRANKRRNDDAPGRF